MIITPPHSQSLQVVHPSSPEGSSNSSKQLVRIEKKLLHYMAKGIHDYSLIKTGDRILVCLSGGKDSWTMLSLLKKLVQRSRGRYEIFAFVLDQSQPGWDDTKLRSYLEDNAIPFDILTKNTYDVVKEKTPEGKTYCGLCSRLRRGNIYNYARTHGFNKVALGHHRDDMLQSLLMSIMFNGQIQSMPPKLLTDDKSLVVIRPLCYVQEKYIIQYSKLKQFPIIPCNLCGNQENLMRVRMKKLIADMSTLNPKIPSNMLHALQHVNPSQLMDKKLWDFDQF